MRIAGRAFLVTGGASGLGAACAAAIAEADGHPVVLDLQPVSGNGAAVQGSVTSYDDVQRAIQMAVSRHGALSGVLHCAGVATAQRTVGKDGPLPLEAFEKVVYVNLVGTFNVARLAAASMMQNAPDESGERGVMVMTSSIAAFDGQVGQAAYAASKAGVAGLVLPLAREFARHGIRFAAIAPGLFDTPLLAGLPPQVKQELGQMAPFPSRLGRPEEFAQMALAIVGNPMLNGEVVRLDGALRMPPK